MKQVLLLLIAIFIPYTIKAQQIYFCSSECDKNISQTKNGYDCLEENKPSTAQIQAWVTDLSKAIDWTIHRQVKLIECVGHNNCTATYDLGNTKTIIYDPQYLKTGRPSFGADNVTSLGGNQYNWRVLAILAHELAHLNKGDLKSSHKISKQERQAIELEADFMSGQMLALLGANKEELIAAGSLYQEAACGNHPKRSDRVASMLRGWSRIKGEGSSVTSKTAESEEALALRAFKNTAIGETNFEKGYWYLKKSKLKEAEQFLLLAYHKDNFKLAAHYLSRVYYDIFDIDKMKLYTEKAIDAGYSLSNYHKALLKSIYKSNRHTNTVNYKKKSFIDVLDYAIKGDVLSQVYLGYMYEYGYSIPEDKQEAIKWYRKAAEQEYALGQIRLGHAYRNGVPEDKNEAIKWYRKAAEQGFVLGY